MDPNTRRLDPEEMAFAEQMLQGDPKAPFPNGTRVEKFYADYGDHHEKGAKGTIMGSLVKTVHGLDICMYLVHFDSDPEETFSITVDIKLKRI